jgi:hypothetical protein
MPVALAVLTVCWLTLWVRWGMEAGGFGNAPAIHPLVMLLVLLAGAAVTRYALKSVQSNLNLQREQRIIGGGGLVAVLVTLWITFGSEFPVGYFLHFTEWGRFISPEAIAFAVAVLLWWRSIRIGRSDDLHDSAQREFFDGILALTLLFVVNKVKPALAASESFWPTMLFFAVGLGAMAVAGLEQERRLQKDSGGLTLSTNRHWLVTVGAIIGLILVGGIIVAGLAAPESLTAFTDLLDTVGVVLITIVGILLYFLVVLLMPIAEMIARALLPILQSLTGLNDLPKLSLPIPTPEEIAAAAEQIARTPPFRIIEIIIVLAIAGLIFLLAVRRFRLLANPNNDNEDRESILSRELLWSQLKALFVRNRSDAASLVPPFFVLDGDDPRLVIRRAYQAMLAWGEQHVTARQPGQTPTQYAHRLSLTAPRKSNAITDLTHAYMRARYGENVSVDDAREAQTAIKAVLADERPAR